ncbi:MAG: hypothetical protein LBK73_14585 [Treponema sp.]|nr:hypothetical protein [Treponema sp.]
MCIEHVSLLSLYEKTAFNQFAFLFSFFTLFPPGFRAKGNRMLGETRRIMLLRSIPAEERSNHIVYEGWNFLAPV